MIESFALIPLTQGLFAIIDLEYLEKVGQFKWSASVRRREDGSTLTYAVRNFRLPNGRRGMEYMHRSLLGATPGAHCDHICGDGLDNRMANLRVCTNAENHHNQRIRTGYSSGRKGVHWHKRDKRWRAYIKIDGKRRHLGYFADVDDAARAYDAAAIQYFGEFARLNFPGERHAQ